MRDLFLKFTRSLRSARPLRYVTPVTVMLVAGMVVFVLTAAVAYLSLEELLMRERAREHARQAQLLIRRTAIVMLDLETGQRGFAITGQASFLEPYERARQQFDVTYQMLKSHLAASPDGPDSPVDLRRLDALTHRRIAQVERNVEQRRAIGDQVLKDLPAFIAGKALMDEIRVELARLEAEQSGYIRRANAGTEAVRSRTIVLAALLPALGSGLIIGAVLALGRERRGRDAADRGLQQANMALEMAVNQRTVQLRAALRRIQEFASELDASVENERRRLAREVHDQIGQIGTATKMLVLGLRRTLPPGFEDSVQELLALADESITTARGIAASLRPPLLDDFGLAAALDHYGQGLARRGGMTVEVDVSDDARLDAAQANTLFRIAQEACTNVLRHAGATLLRLVGRLDAADTYFRFEIIDNGKGPGSVRADASGLRNMRERAALQGGLFEFEPAEGGGTRVAVSLPLAPEVIQ